MQPQAALQFASRNTTVDVVIGQRMTNVGQPRTDLVAFSRADQFYLHQIKPNRAAGCRCDSGANHSPTALTALLLDALLFHRHLMRTLVAAEEVQQELAGRSDARSHQGGVELLDHRATFPAAEPGSQPSERFLIATGHHHPGGGHIDTVRQTAFVQRRLRWLVVGQPRLHIRPAIRVGNANRVPARWLV